MDYFKLWLLTAVCWAGPGEQPEPVHGGAGGGGEGDSGQTDAQPWGEGEAAYHRHHHDQVSGEGHKYTQLFIKIHTIFLHRKSI